jgi:hypothetical protein
MPGPLSRVDVLNFPASQAVTGTFWPSVQPVSGSVGISGTVPVSQSGAWSVGITGTPTVNANVTFPANQQVSGMVAATQSGPWSVGVTSLPSIPAGTATIGSVNVNGTVPVSGTFWQATQPISATSLPLPAGAATASGVAAVVTALGSPLQQGGAVSVSNFPATQPVSATALPLPSGASTAALQTAGNNTLTTINNTLGSPLQAGGTVVANLGTLNGAATAARQDTIIASLGTPFNVAPVPGTAAANGIVPVRASNTASIIAKNSAGNFYGCTVVSNPNGANAYVMVMDRATVPAANASITQSEIFAMTGFVAGGLSSIAPDMVPDRFNNGCVVVISTSTTTYTPPTSNLPLFIKVRAV